MIRLKRYMETGELTSHIRLCHAYYVPTSELTVEQVQSLVELHDDEHSTARDWPGMIRHTHDAPQSADTDEEWSWDGPARPAEKEWEW